MAYDVIQATTQPNPNYFINGDFRVAQKGQSAVIAAGTSVPTASLGYPIFDCWYVYSVGGNPTLSQVTSNGGSTPYYLQLTGAAGISSFGIGQRIEAINSANLALKTVTVSFECSNSLLTSVSIAAYRPATTSNTFGTVATPTKTLINNTSININNTLTRYSWTFVCPQEVDKGIEIVFNGGAQTSGTFVLSNVKLELGAVPTPFTTIDYGNELIKCKRYLQYIPYNMLFSAYTANAVMLCWQNYPVEMFINPTAGPLEIDPSTTPSAYNNINNSFTYKTTKGVAMYQQANIQDNSYTLGYRAQFSAYIP